MFKKAKNVLIVCASAAIFALVTINVSVNLRGESLSDLSLANIEALARNEIVGADCDGIMYKTCTFSGSSTGLINPNVNSSCSLPCSNVTTNGVYGDTYKCM